MVTAADKTRQAQSPESQRGGLHRGGPAVFCAASLPDPFVLMDSTPHVGSNVVTQHPETFTPSMRVTIVRPLTVFPFVY